VLSEVLLILVDLHPAGLEKPPKLPSPVVSEVSIDFEVLLEVHHAWWEILIDDIYIFESEVKFPMYFGLIDSFVIDLLESVSKK
jgi:hypothetical protein